MEERTLGQFEEHTYMEGRTLGQLEEHTYVEPDPALAEAIHEVTGLCLAQMKGVLEGDTRLDATMVMAASGAVAACARLWEAVRGYGMLTETVQMLGPAEKLNANGIPVHVDGDDR